VHKRPVPDRDGREAGLTDLEVEPGQSDRPAKPAGVGDVDLELRPRHANTDIASQVTSIGIFALAATTG